MLSLLWLAHEALCAPAAGALSTVWDDAQPMMKAQGTLSTFVLEEGDAQRLVGGAVLKRRGVSRRGGDLVQALVWLPYSPDRLWVAINDDRHNQLTEGLEEEVLHLGADGSKVLYQRLDLPMPFQDRHWVIQIRNNSQLYSTSGGHLWERTWGLHEKGEAAVPVRLQEQAQGAVFTPVNRGGWGLIPVEGGTLILYEVESDVGGFVPDSLVARFTYAGLDDLVVRVSQGARDAPFHYKEGHEPFALPDGSSVASWPRTSP